MRRSDRVSNVRIFKEIEKKIMGDVTLCYVFGHLSSVKCLVLFQNICSDASMVQDLLESRENSSQNKKLCPAPKCCIFK